MYIYNADLWCDSCGEAICEDLIARGEAPADPEYQGSYDSGEFPKSAIAGETDSPRHCAAGSECLEALDLAPYGAESVRIGALIEDDLTDDGVEYLCEMLDCDPRTPYQAALHAFWREAFADYL